MFLYPWVFTVHPPYSPLVTTDRFWKDSEEEYLGNLVRTEDLKGVDNLVVSRSIHGLISILYRRLGTTPSTPQVLSPTAPG